MRDILGLWGASAASLLIILTVAYGGFCGLALAFDKIMPSDALSNWQRIDKNFKNIVYTKIYIPPSTGSYSFDTSCDETASVSVGTVNSTTGNYVTQLTQSLNNITVVLSATSVDTTEVSVITIYK